jgi:hypothetical protein
MQRSDVADLLAKIRQFHAGAAALASRLERHDPKHADPSQHAALRRIGSVLRDIHHAIGATTNGSARKVMDSYATPLGTSKES